MMDYKFTKGKFMEAQLEEAFIELFRRQGYTYVSGDAIHRKYTDVLLGEDLRSYLRARYASAGLTDAEMEKIVSRLELIPQSPLYEGNRAAFRLVNEGFDLVRDDPSLLALHVEFIDFDHPENNIFKVVNQYTVKGSSERRPDLLVFINGIPVAIFEFKTAIREDTTVHDAWEQITIRYARDIPNLLKYCFLSVISDGANTKLGSIFTPYPYYYAWNKANDKDSVANGISSLFTMIEGAFARDRILRILRDFIFYPDNSRKQEVIVCRYPQFFAAEKLLANIKRHMRPNGDGKGGTYFGATGCGKTYIMLFLARLIQLRDVKAFGNPTIIILVDREDLDSQTSSQFAVAKKFLHEDDVRSIESRADLSQTLKGRPSGGVYITSIQKFCEGIGLLSDRSNIICISDEAHRTQTGVSAYLKKTDKGVFTTYGFAKYLRDSFPNATYCGFSGTPIDATFAVFGDLVDSYTMKESSDDGITVRISYEPRLARVLLSEEMADKIQKYYDACAEAGANPSQIEESQRAMSQMREILGHPERRRKMAEDIVAHYEALCAEKPNIVQKAMIVCADRLLAYDLLQEILKIRPEWGEKRRSERKDALPRERLEQLQPLPKINLVATQGSNDPPDLFDCCGTKKYRKMLEQQFKNNDSNFKIAVVVDMWITGFDVPSLSVMYIDKPLRRHTLIQTISRVNRVFEGKDKGIIVDYIGIKKAMMDAVKVYGGKDENPVDDLALSLDIFRNELSILDDLMYGFQADMFYTGAPLERLNCLNQGAEYVQTSKDRETRFMGHSRRLKLAYEICCPSGELTDAETARAQFYLAIRSIIYKQTKGNTPDAEIMNSVVERMVEQALSCTGVENIIDDKKSEDLFSTEFMQELNKVKMPITKFNALLKLLKRAIRDYGRTNKAKALEFAERLKRVVDEYNNRDNLAFANEVAEDFVNNLSDRLYEIYNDLLTDKSSFEKMGISFEEKAFYDILVHVRDEHHFVYEDEKCIALARKIKKLVDDNSQFADWATRSDIKSQLESELILLLYDNGYPPEWKKTVFEQVLEQAENFKKYAY